MNIKEKIDELMSKKGIRSYTELLMKIYKENGYKKDIYVIVNKEKSNFSKMLIGERGINKDYYYPLEKLLGISIYDLLTSETTISPKYDYKLGLRYVASSNSYEEFIKLGEEKVDEYSYVIDNLDEYNKSIMDYVLEYDSLAGIKYLIKRYNLKYDQTRDYLYSDDYQKVYQKSYLEKIVSLIIKNDDFDSFNKLFNTYEIYLETNENKNNLVNSSEFFNRILGSNKILDSLFNTKEISFRNLNLNINIDKDFNILMINPILTKLLNAALENPIINYDKIEKIVLYAKKENQKVIEYILDLNLGIINELHINENGILVLGHRTYYGSLIQPNETINPSLAEILKNYIDEIKDINNSITGKELIKNGKNCIILNQNGNFIKKSGTNDIEYQIYSNFRNKIREIPYFIGRNSNVDEFRPFEGIRIYQQLNANQLRALASFLKRLHLLSKNYLETEVYVHGNFKKDSFYFEGDNLVTIIGWDNAHIGNKYEDIISLIINETGMINLFRNNDETIRNIFTILNEYGADKEYRTLLVKSINEFIDGKIKILNGKDDKAIEKLMWCKAFMMIYSIKIINL